MNLQLFQLSPHLGEDRPRALALPGARGGCLHSLTLPEPSKKLPKCLSGCCLLCLTLGRGVHEKQMKHTWDFQGSLPENARDIQHKNGIFLNLFSDLNVNMVSIICSVMSDSL